MLADEFGVWCRITHLAGCRRLGLQFLRGASLLETLFRTRFGLTDFAAMVAVCSTCNDII
jgi:hypothetical protein